MRTPEPSPPTTRRRAALAVCVAAASVASPAGAQPVGGPAATTVLLRDTGSSRAQSTYAAMGIRRGVRSVEGVRFLHPVDELEGGVPGEELEFALARLDPLADQMRTGDTRDAARQADEVIEVLEANLPLVRRSQLVDAYMIGAISRCLLGRRRECRRRIAEVLTFREGLEYDAARYGPESETAFERARAQTLSGPRGALVVETEPPGAEVFIDGRSYGPSPARADGLLAGRHYVTVKELGFQRLVARAEVERSDETTVSLRLEPGERAALLDDSVLQRLRPELGQPRASPDLVSLFRGTIPAATQVILGVTRPAAGSAIQVQLFLYHMGTRNLQGQQEVTISADEAGVARLQETVASMYRGVDLSGGLEAPEEENLIVEPGPELYEQWWFWTSIVGAVALVGAGIAIGFALEGGDRLPDQDHIRVGVNW